MTIMQAAKDVFNREASVTGWLMRDRGDRIEPVLRYSSDDFSRSARPRRGGYPRGHIPRWHPRLAVEDIHPLRGA